MAIVVLCKDKSGSSTSIILTSLAVCDLLGLLLGLAYNFSKNYIFYFSETEFYNIQTAETLADMIVYFALPLYASAVYGSHVITVMVTIDRYIAVCKPMMVRRKKQVIVTLIVLVVYVLVYHIPIYFDYVTIKYAGLYRENFYTGYTKPVMRIVERDSLHNSIPYQVVYKIILASVLRDLGPILLLTVFNIKLYRALNNMKQRYLNMRRGSNKLETRKHMSSSESLTRTVVIVVATYTVLTLPSLVLKLIITIRQIAYAAETEMGDMIGDRLAPAAESIHWLTLGNLLITVASSANFIIYIIFAKKFKKIFISTFCNFAIVKRRFEDVMMTSSSDTARGNSKMAVAASKVEPLGQKMNTVEVEVKVEVKASHDHIETDE